MADADRDPRTVIVTNNPKAADAVVELLASKDIGAEVYTPPPKTVSEPLTGMAELAISEEFEVRVTDPAKAADAKELLATLQQFAQVRSVREQREQRTGTVTAVCEDCGKSSDWQAAAMGTTETCPHCSSYMDIPDPDDDWSGVDFGTGEEEDEGEPEEEGK